MVKNLKFKNLLLIILAGFVFVSCSSKSNKIREYDKPAIYWYNKMAKSIASGFLEDADDSFTSLESEHGNSPLLPTAFLILANAHIDEEEYALANFYLDEYIKRFTLSKNIDYARYLKIKANFLGFAYDLRDQQLLEDTIKDIAYFKHSFPNSAYLPLVNTINARIYMAKASLDKEIADLYKRLDKPKASKYYEQKVKESWVKPSEINPVDIPFYRYPFEENLF